MIKIDNKVARLLVRMENCADITFLVGSDSTPVRANKTALATQSDVFANLFFGDSPSPTEVSVPDVDVFVFSEIISFIYTRTVHLTKCNADELLKAAIKYGLHDLQVKCETFIADRVNSWNCLEIYAAHQSYNNCSIINQKCFDFLLHNPVFHFKDPAILELGASALKELVQQPAMNCNPVDLEKVVMKWMKKNHDPLFEFNAENNVLLEKVTGITMDLLMTKQPFGLVKKSFEQLGVEEFSQMMIVVKTNEVSLYGIGVYTGIQPYRQGPGMESVRSSYVVETIHIDVQEVYVSEQNSVNSSPYKKSHHISQQIIQTFSPGIQDIMFEKMDLPPHSWILITVDFGCLKTRTVSSEIVCDQDHPHRNKCKLWRLPNKDTKRSCLAYLLCDPPN